jgi:hypothetical protein
MPVTPNLIESTFHRYCNTHLAKINIGQVLNSRIAQMTGFLNVTDHNSITDKSFINYFICQRLRYNPFG